MRWISGVVVLNLFCAAHAASVPVDPRSCEPIPDHLLRPSAQLVGHDWPEYRRFMCLYPVKSPAGSTALFILALDADRADAANALVLHNGKPVPGGNDSGNNDPIPLPRVIDRRGTLLATFPDRLWFPKFDPGTTSVSFSKWHDGFPHMFRLRVFDPTVTGPGRPYCPPPFIWDTVLRRYIEAKGDFYARCP